MNDRVARDRMHDEGLLEDHGPMLPAPPRARPSRPGLVLLAAALTALISAGVCVGAILGPAPAVAIPLVVAICVGCPIFACWEVPNALAALRANRGHRALARLRQSLDRLPETEHPLGF